MISTFFLFRFIGFMKAYGPKVLPAVMPEVEEEEAEEEEEEDLPPTQPISESVVEEDEEVAAAAADEGLSAKKRARLQ
jgi:hypothetical protein